MNAEMPPFAPTEVKFDEEEFQGRIVLVVGGSKGIGAETARLATSLNARLVAINSRQINTALMEELKEENIRRGTLSRFIGGDITVPGVPTTIIREASGMGRLDDVVIAAGIRDD